MPAQHEHSTGLKSCGHAKRFATIPGRGTIDGVPRSIHEIERSIGCGSHLRLLRGRSWYGKFNTGALFGDDGTGHE